MANTDPRRNSEGYYDPTAYLGMKPIVDEENALQREVNALIKVLKYIISKSGFELVNRIEIRDKQTGKTFR